MAKLKLDDILPCPFCGAVPRYRDALGQEVCCPTSPCPSSFVWIPLARWQTRSIPDLKQAYTQFEESIKAERAKTDRVFRKIFFELADGRYEENARLVAEHAKAIREVVEMAKEYLNA